MRYQLIRIRAYYQKTSTFQFVQIPITVHGAEPGMPYSVQSDDANVEMGVNLSWNRKWARQEGSPTESRFQDVESVWRMTGHVDREYFFLIPAPWKSPCAQTVVFRKKDGTHETSDIWTEAVVATAPVGWSTFFPVRWRIGADFC